MNNLIGYKIPSRLSNSFGLEVWDWSEEFGSYLVKGINWTTGVYSARDPFWIRKELIYLAYNENEIIELDSVSKSIREAYLATGNYFG